MDVFSCCTSWSSDLPNRCASWSIRCQNTVLCDRWAAGSRNPDLPQRGGENIVRREKWQEPRRRWKVQGRSGTVLALPRSRWGIVGPGKRLSLPKGTEHWSDRWLKSALKHSRVLPRVIVAVAERWRGVPEVWVAQHNTLSRKDPRTAAGRRTKGTRGKAVAESNTEKEILRWWSLPHCFFRNLCPYLPPWVASEHQLTLGLTGCWGVAWLLPRDWTRSISQPVESSDWHTHFQFPRTDCV